VRPSLSPRSLNKLHRTDLTRCSDRNDGAWDSFLAGFNSVPTNHALDHGEASTCAAMALVISTIGRSNAVKRIYLAGVNLEELHETLPDLRPNKATLFHVDLVPKLVLRVVHSRSLDSRPGSELTSSSHSSRRVDHRETDDARETLLTSGWRVARFLRYFSSHHGLGCDLGWAYRPSTPILGPGDQCVPSRSGLSRPRARTDPSARSQEPRHRRRRERLRGGVQAAEVPGRGRVEHGKQEDRQTGREEVRGRRSVRHVVQLVRASLALVARASLEREM